MFHPQNNGRIPEREEELMRNMIERVYASSLIRKSPIVLEELANSELNMRDRKASFLQNLTRQVTSKSLEMILVLPRRFASSYQRLGSTVCLSPLKVRAEPSPDDTVQFKHCQCSLQP